MGSRAYDMNRITELKIFLESASPELKDLWAREKSLDIAFQKVLDPEKQRAIRTKYNQVYSRIREIVNIEREAMRRFKEL